MGFLLRIILFVIFFVTQVYVFADELLIIQAVSTTKRTFAINKGFVDGIAADQEAVFTTNKVAIIAKATQVTRQFSVWEASNKNALVPFQKGEFVMFTSSVEKLHLSIAKVDIRLQERASLAPRMIYVPKSSFLIRGALSQTMFESTTETKSTVQTVRRGYHGEILYNTKIFKQLEWGIGGRYDYEVARMENPIVLMPTVRYFGLTEVTYHFVQFKKSDKSMYGSIGVGIGKSATTIDNDIISGSSTLLPVARIGLLSPWRRYGISLLIEAVAESISTTEYFSDNHKQTTNMINGKLSIGVKF